MKRKRNKLPRRILNILVVIAAVCVVGYFAFCYWVNASGSLVGDHLPDPEDVKGFDEYLERYTKGLPIEAAAVQNL